MEEKNTKTIHKPCPFCYNPNTPENDSGGACCFCDYQGYVTIGYGGNFSNFTQYKEIYYASNHQDRIDKLHGGNSNDKIKYLYEYS